MDIQISSTNRHIKLAVFSLISAGFYAISLYNYLLFHTLAELFSVVVAGMIFVLAWNTRSFLSNGYLLYMGLGLLSVGGIDLVHTLAFRGMGVFPGATADLPTQLWIAARYLQVFILLTAFRFIRRPVRPLGLFIGLGTILTLILFSIFIWDIFPTCYVEGQGLTPFKKISEYLIAAGFVLGIFLLLRNRDEFDPYVLKLLIWMAAASVLAELAFTEYVNVYGFANMLGHIFKILAFFFIYRAIVVTGFVQPVNLLFRNLKQGEEDLRRAHDELEVRVTQRTEEVIAVNQALKGEIEQHMQTEAELRKYRERLEELVAARTAELQREIAERKRAEADAKLYARRLERSNRELEDFAFVASHDLQEPLRKIEAFGERLRSSEALAKSEKEQDYLDRMQSAAGRMKRLLNDLLAYSRVNTKARPFVEVSLDEIVAAVLQDLDIRLEQSGGQVEVGPLPSLLAESIQMRQLFQNLIGNALKFHRKDVPPLVRVSGEVIPGENGDRPQARIRVEDNGIGFPPGSAGKIFQPFQRLVSREEYEGSGMGLAICSKIVEYHGGQITVYSQPEQGTVFEILLPMAEAYPGNQQPIKRIGEES